MEPDSNTPDRRSRRAVHQRRDLGVRVDLDEAGAELVAFADIDQPCVVFGVLVIPSSSSSNMIVTFTPFGVASE
jgi:hypothetical protein